MAPWLFIACADMSPQESHNFVLNSQGQRVSWAKKKVTVGLHTSAGDADTIYALEEALLIWEQMTGLDLFEYVGVLSQDEINKADIKIYWRKDVWEESKKMEQARTLIQWRGAEIYNAVMGINDKDYDFFVHEKVFGKVDLVAIFVHELGHALGLDHIIEPNSVMQPQLAKNVDDRRIPQPGDIESLQHEYF